MHSSSFLNLGEAIVRYNLREATANFVKEAFECQICFTVETGKLLAFSKLRPDKKRFPPRVCNFCSFWRSYCEKDPASSFLGFDNLNQKQWWKYTSSVKWSEVKVWKLCIFTTKLMSKIWH